MNCERTQLLFICLCPTTTTTTTTGLKSSCLTVLWQDLTVGNQQTVRLKDTEMDIDGNLLNYVEVVHLVQCMTRTQLDHQEFVMSPILSTLLLNPSMIISMSIILHFCSLVIIDIRQPTGTSHSKTLRAKSRGKTGKISGLR